MQLQTGVMSYGGSSHSQRAGRHADAIEPACKATSPQAGRRRSTTAAAAGPSPERVPLPRQAARQHAAQSNGQPDFARMTAAEKLAYNKAKRDRIFG